MRPGRRSDRGREVIHDGWRRMLRPLIPLYAGAVAAKYWLRTQGWLRERRLRHPVISVGSLSAGGAGKTPVVVMLAELLSARGYEIRILTRGYGRVEDAVERVNPDGNPARFGDEPMMMARRLPEVAVWVGADRYRAGRMSEKGDRDGAKVLYLLDDGFQHTRLARDLDVVLLTRQDLLDELLPAGYLREPLRAIQRADIVVLREEEGFAGEVSGRATTWFVRRTLRFARPVAGRIVAFCGLARPRDFFAMLAEAGVDVAATSVFRDHHRYSLADIERLVELGRAHKADGFVTTEKDAVKLTLKMRERLGVVAVPELRVELRAAEEKVTKMVGTIEMAGRV